MKTVTISGKAMHYQDVGEGPVVLLGHSFLWDHTMWTAQVQSLASDYRCIVPDLWAHGESDTVSESPYTVEQLATDHLALLDALDIERAVVVGLSVGGMWATDLALGHPDRVSGLVLANTFVGAEPEMKRERYFGMLDIVEHMQRLPPALIDDVVPLFFSPDALAENLPVIDPFRESLEAWPTDMIDGMVAIGRGISSRTDRLPQLASLSCPLLVIAGEHDASRPAAESAEMVSVVEDARLKVLNCGHISAVEQHAAVTQAVRGFLDEIDWR